MGTNLNRVLLSKFFLIIPKYEFVNCRVIIRRINTLCQPVRFYDSFKNLAKRHGFYNNCVLAP